MMSIIVRMMSKIKLIWNRIRSIYGFCLHRSDYDRYEFLPSYLSIMKRPPTSSARITAIMLSVFVLLTFIWSYFGQLAIHATATGRLILPSRSQTIQSYELCEVAEILVQNGQSVKKGDKLLTLNIVGLTQDIKRLQKQKTFQQLEVALYSALLSDNPLNPLVLSSDIDASILKITSSYLTSSWQEHLSILSKLDADIDTNKYEQMVLKKRLDGLQKLKNNIQKRLLPSRRLAKSNFMAKMTLLEREKEALDNQLSIDSKEEELKVLQARSHTLLESKFSYIAQKKRDWNDKLNKSVVSLLISEQELAKAEARSKLQIIRAPIDGIVQQLAVYTIGGVVQGAQKLMLITPHDGAQQAEIDIANKDIGFIRSGQPVTVKIEAFPYSRYGTINGRIQSISLDSVKRSESSPELVFPAQIELEKNYIMIDNQPVILTPGMTIVTEIKIGKRRVIDYLLSPVREYRSEACREP
ncbi:HlyD family type I secretion periplasmic adaptor subunit [Candidatus Cardinium hertigii]|uniref:HlyD family type I secretion periplasmic adaptor subunit n=1 Tax=Candidatus Cardinium hertigii TaxID=247481 RepID=UPI003D7D3819